jgi:cobalt-zinc-cadmium efflux system outer membrane protein
MSWLILCPPAWSQGGARLLAPVETSATQPATSRVNHLIAQPNRGGPNEVSPPHVVVQEGLALDAAVHLALEKNPQLAVFRQQHGIAAAGIVIARTYPYNPVVSAQMLKVTGTPVTNDFQYQPVVNLAVEIRGQRRFRQQAAFAALTRTDWEIAFQEVTFAVNAVRAFDNVLYRQAKLHLTEEFLRLNQKGADQVKLLVDGGQLRPADLILARAEVTDIQSQLGLGRTALITAQRDFARAVGLTEVGEVKLHGTMSRPVPDAGAEELLEAALEHRPDLFAQHAAVTEADARVRLQIADRFGNPTIGPGYEFDPGRLSYVGGQISIPFPIFNRRQGEIQLLQAQAAQTRLKVRQIEVEIRQDVSAAVQRLVEARAWVKNYQQDVLPTLAKSLEGMESLFKQGQPGVDVLRVLDVRRKLIRAQDGYLDALLLYSQALADLALAVGDPALSMGLYQPANQTDKK